MRAPLGGCSWADCRQMRVQWECLKCGARLRSAGKLECGNPDDQRCLLLTAMVEPAEQQLRPWTQWDQRHERDKK